MFILSCLPYVKVGWVQYDIDVKYTTPLVSEVHRKKPRFQKSAVTLPRKGEHNINNNNVAAELASRL